MTSTDSRQRVDAGPPVDDAVAAATRSTVNPTPAGTGRRLSSKLCRAQAAGHAVLRHQPGHAGPAEPDQHVHARGQAAVVGAGRQHRAAQGDDARTPGPGGVRRGHARACRPGCARRSAPGCRAGSRSTPAAPRAGRRRSGCSRRWRGCATGRCGSPARRSAPPSAASVPSPAMKPGTSTTGSPPAVRAAAGVRRAPARAPVPQRPQRVAARLGRPRCPRGAPPRPGGGRSPPGCRNAPRVVDVTSTDGTPRDRRFPGNGGRVYRIWERAVDLAPWPPVPARNPR